MIKVAFLIVFISLATLAGEFTVPNHSSFTASKLSPLNADFDGDGTNDVMVKDQDGQNYAIYSYSKKEYLADFLNHPYGFDYSLSDLDNDGAVELISLDGNVIYSYAGGTSSRKK